MKELNRMWFQPSAGGRALSDMPDLSTDDIKDDIMEIIDRLRQVGLGKVIVYDLTRKEPSVPVVRVIVPGLEVYALDQDRVGRRFMEATQP
jgi:ribosomal protein S12 methylthiotransferase accessory factor